MLCAPLTSRAATRTVRVGGRQRAGASAATINAICAVPVTRHHQGPPPAGKRPARNACNGSR